MHIGYYCYGFVDNLYPAQDVSEGETSVIMIIYDKSLEDLIFEEIRKYKSKHYQVILLSCENVGAMEHLCDDVIYVADGKVKLGLLTSGVPMLYAVERIVGILTKDEIEESLFTRNSYSFFIGPPTQITISVTYIYSE